MYIVGAKWWDKWKLYTSFDETSNSFTRKSVSEANYPGRLLNEDILDDKRDYYLRTEDPDYLQTPLKPMLRENKDYKVLNKKCGKLLYRLFGGTPVIRSAVRVKDNLKPVVYPSLVFVHPKYR